jgi:hypothetical protein
MARLDGGEVAAVERDHDLASAAFGECDHAGVGAAERRVRVAFDELGDARQSSTAGASTSS